MLAHERARLIADRWKGVLRMPYQLLGTRLVSRRVIAQQ